MFHLRKATEVKKFVRVPSRNVARWQEFGRDHAAWPTVPTRAAEDGFAELWGEQCRGA